MYSASAPSFTRCSASPPKKNSIASQGALCSSTAICGRSPSNANGLDVGFSVVPVRVFALAVASAVDAAARLSASRRHSLCAAPTAGVLDPACAGDSVSPALVWQPAWPPLVGISDLPSRSHCSGLNVRLEEVPEDESHSFLCWAWPRGLDLSAELRPSALAQSGKKVRPTWPALPAH